MNNNVVTTIIHYINHYFSKQSYFMKNSKSNRRDFLRKSVLSAMGLAALNTKMFSNVNSVSGFIDPDFTINMDGAFTQAPLQYGFADLEPHIDKMTMEIHYGKHHAGYVKNLNDAVAATPELQGKTLEEIVKHISKAPETIRTKVRNNAGGHWNHTFFWETLSPASAKTEVSDKFRSAMMAQFNDMDTFKTEFNKAATSVFGSGWAWLIKDDTGALKIVSTPNQDNPMMDISENRGIPLLGVDVWEHAYYLKYQNRRADYLTAFWNVINWNTVSERFS